MPTCRQTGIRAAGPDDASFPSFNLGRLPRRLARGVDSRGRERCAARPGAAAACRAELVHPASLVRGHRPRTATMVFQAATWSSAILVFARLRRWGMPMRRRIATSPGPFEPARQELLAGPGFRRFKILKIHRPNSLASSSANTASIAKQLCFAFSVVAGLPFFNK